MPTGQNVVINSLLAGEIRPSGNATRTVQFEKGGPSCPAEGTLHVTTIDEVDMSETVAFSTNGERETAEPTGSNVQ